MPECSLIHFVLKFRSESEFDLIDCLNLYLQMVASWSPLQLEREERAKCRSSVFLFNLTRDARSLASLLEIAFLTGMRTHLNCIVQFSAVRVQRTDSNSFEPNRAIICSGDDGSCE